MDQETRQFLEQKFEAIDKKFVRIDEKFEETKRHFSVAAEGLEHKIQLVAEGVANLDEKLYREITVLREEMKAEFSEVKAMISFPMLNWIKESERSKAGSWR